MSTTHPEPITASLDDYIADIAEVVRSGQLVYFLGAGVNYSQRFALSTPAGGELKYQTPESGFLPTGGELADYLKRIYPPHGLRRED